MLKVSCNMCVKSYSIVPYLKLIIVLVVLVSEAIAEDVGLKRISGSGT